MNIVRFRCRLSENIGMLPHFWEHTVGSGHASLGLRADWQNQLRQCREELGFRHVRFHALLSEPMGTLVCEEDELIYSFHNADLIFDFLLSVGMKPFVELSFMPEALASGHATVFHYKANVTPPKDYHKWAVLISKFASHLVERYGASEVRQWFFEVWNEPNLKAFWSAKQREYFKFYRTTVEAIKKVDQHLRVGGPATASNEWIEDFLGFTDGHDVPVDFVSTHHYPTDALGTADEDTEEELAQSRRSILRQWAQETHRRVGGRPLYYTEWNVSSNPRGHLHDEPYAAAVIIKTMMEARGLVNGYSFWTFSDIFSENYFPSIPFHGGFGLLTLHGIAKPAYRAFQLLHALGNEMLLVDGIHSRVDCWVVRSADKATVLITNHALPKHHIRKEEVYVELESEESPKNVYVERIDDHHANAKHAWIRMGKPEYLSESQLKRLHEASRLTRQEIAWKFHEGKIQLHLVLPPHAVASVTVQFTSTKSDREIVHAKNTRHS